MSNSISLFSCPVCGGRLTKKERTLICDSCHSFDMAKEGYVNLLCGKGSERSGDDKMMVSARTRFLDGGYYAPLRAKVCELLDSLGAGCDAVLDSGCGEGYYTSEYARHSGSICGIDISKTAVKKAAKRCRDAEFAVASVYNMPIPDESVNIIINCFSPMAKEEFLRVLKPGGYLIYIVPGKRHLWELKSILYDSPYENEEKVEQYEGFEHMDAHHVITDFCLDRREDIDALYHMTPYTWTTPKDGAERLAATEIIEKMTAEFYVHVYRKI